MKRKRREKGIAMEDIFKILNTCVTGISEEKRQTVIYMCNLVISVILGE